MEREELVSLGLGEVTHTRPHKPGQKPRGRKPGITTEEILNRGQKTKTKFVPPERKPTSSESRLMFSLVLEHAIKTTMKNHIYSYNGQLFRQKRGAAIGLKLSGSLAVFATQVWSKRFNDLLAKANSDTIMLKLYMSSYYMDDGNWAAKALPPGCRLVEGKLEIVQSEVENDCQIPADIRTGEIIREIGNSINNYIRLTVDTPSSHPSGWMPILNIQVKVENNKIVYKWFRKEMSNYLLLLANSAMPWRTKRECLVQYAMTILLNTSRQLPWEVVADTLSEFSHRMLVSGYNSKFRLEVIQAAVVGYERKVARAESGGPPLYRPRDYQPEERRKKKLMSKTSWYRPANTVGFFPATPNAVLAKKFQEILTEELGRLKMNGRIIEESGVSLRAPRRQPHSPWSQLLRHLHGV